MRTLISLSLLLLTATAQAAITGTVVDENGKPIAGATVRAWAAESSRAYRQRLVSTQPENEPLATATTDDAGAFSVDAKGNIAVDLRIDKQDRRSAAMDAVDGDEPLTVILRPAGTRKLRVEAGGKPVANALVVFGSHLMARTDSAGQAPMLEESAAWIIHPDFPITRPSPQFGPSTVIKLQKGVTLKGRVVNAKGEGVKADLLIAGMPAGSSGDDGAFTVARAPANWTSLRAVAGKDAALATRTSAPSIALRLAPGSLVSGMVRDVSSGRGIAGARVRLQGENEGFDVAVSDPKGNFAFDAMPPRAYGLYAFHPAYAFEPLTVAAGEGSNRVIVSRAMARLRGRVIDEGRKPVGGAVVSYGGGRPNTITDQAGNFSLRVAPVQNQMISLTAVKRGYATGSSPRRRLKDGETVDDIVIPMAAGFPLQVRVVDPRRQPVPGVLVYAGVADDDSVRAMAACDDPWQDGCHVTDAKGAVNLRVTEGQYSLTVMPSGDDGIAPRRIASQQITAKSSPLVIEVEKGVAVSGKVAYSDGTPVAEVTVEIRGGGNNRREPSTDGTFNILGLGSGKYTLLAMTADGYISTPSVDVTAPAANVVLTMPRGGRIEGRVVERGTGRPITDFVAAPGRRDVVMFRPQGEKETHSESGAFVVENVPPGPTTLRVAARGYVTGTRSDIQVEEGRAVTGIEVQLERGAKLTGRVTAEGKPLSGVGVRTISLTGPSFGPAAGVTDADGQYSLDSLPAGEPTFEFRKQGYVSKRQNVEIAAAKEAQLDVELERGRDLRGRVADKAGAAIEGATVSANPSGMGGESTQTITAADGGFVLEGLGESRYNVQVRKSGFASASQRDVSLPQSAPITITLDRGGMISGRVTGLTQNDLGSVYVTASGEGSFASAHTDAGGSFTLRGVPDGRITVQASVMGSDRRSKPKSLVVENGSAAPIDISFEEGFTLRGRVTFNGVPAASGYINFRQRDVQQPGVSGRVSSGTYEVSGFSAGEYDVILTSSEGGYRGKYTVTGSGTFDIEVRGATLRGRVVDAESSAPVAEANVSVSGKGATAFSSAMSDSDGRFVVPALADGKYTMTVHRETYATATQEVEIAGGVAQDMEVRLEGGTPMTFLVVDATTGAAVMNAGVWVNSENKRIANGMSRTDDGVRLWLRSGRYFATANAYGYASSAAVEFSVPGPSVRIVLGRAGSLVIIARSAGQARLRSTVTTSPARGTGGVVSGVTTSAARLVPFVVGVNAPMENLSPGLYTLEVLDEKRNVVKRLPVTIVSGEKTTVTVD